MGEYAGKYVKNEYYNDGEAPERSVDVEGIGFEIDFDDAAIGTGAYEEDFEEADGAPQDWLGRCIDVNRRSPHRQYCYMRQEFLKVFDAHIGK